MDDLAVPAELTFLFTDMEASTPAWDLDADAMDAAQRRHDAILHEAIAAHEGRIFATAGDGVGAAFAKADEAVSAAVEAQRSLLDEPWPTAAPIRVRMGLHTGSAIERNGDYFGPTVIRAARLMALVEGGRIICSTATKTALPSAMGDHVRLLPVGTVPLKGFSTPEPALAVQAAGLPEQGTPLMHAPEVRRRPRVSSSLIGREGLIADVAERLSVGVLVTLVGVGGVGKTRLALAVADRVAPSYEQVAWVDLATSSDASEIVHELASLFGVRALGDQDLVDVLMAAVGEREVLVVFDNCEHVLSTVRSLADELLQRCAGVTVMATSRERIGVPSERIVPVRPLPSAGDGSAAVELVLARLEVERAELDDLELAMLVEICVLLDGIPLDLELVAARCRQLGIVEVGRRLPHHLGHLADPTRPVRHRTLEGTIEWSYALLDPAEQGLMRTLAVFGAPFDLDAVEAVTGDDSGDVGELVASLLDKSLLERDGQRFRMLEMTRDFAMRRLDAGGEGEARRAAHIRYVRHRVVELRWGLHGRDEARFVEQLDDLWPDVRTAVRRSLDRDDAEAVMELVTQLAFEAFWRRPEAFAWIEEAATRYGDRPGPHRHELLGAAGIAAWTQLDIPRAMRLGAEATAADAAPGTALDCLPQGALIGAFNFSGQFDEAAAAARRALVGLEHGPDRWNLAVMHANLTMSLGVGGIETTELDDELSTTIAAAHSTGNPTAIAYAYLVHAIAATTRDVAVTRRAIESARAYASVVENRWVLMTAATTIAASPSDARPDDGALALSLAAADDLHRTGWSTHAWSALWGIIDGLYGLGRQETAAVVLGGCESSGIARLAYQHVPTELEGASGTLTRYRSLGTHLSLDDVLAIASGRRAPPLVP